MTSCKGGLERMKLKVVKEARQPGRPSPFLVLFIYYDITFLYYLFLSVVLFIYSFIYLLYYCTIYSFIYYIIVLNIYLFITACNCVISYM